MSYPQQPPPQDPYQPQQPQPPVVPSAPPVSPAGYGQPMSPGPYGQPYPQQYQQPMVVVAPALPTSAWAIASLIFGILGMVGGFCLFGIPCIAAVICGHAGMRDTNGGVKSGRGMAIAGLILGYLFVAPAIIIFVTGGIGSVLPGSTTSP
jgi:hypothetical protein